MVTRPGFWIGIAALLGMLTVILGAFGAHALGERLDARALGWWQTAVQYQAWHALALLGVAALWSQLSTPWALTSAILLVVGTFIFAGSLYIMALGGPRILGAVTPLGGLAWIGAWAALAIAAWRG